MSKIRIFGLPQLVILFAVGIAFAINRQSGQPRQNYNDLPNLICLGTFFFNVSTDPQTNWYRVFGDLGAPLWFVGESWTVVLARYDSKTYYFSTVATPSNLLVQELWFQIGVENVTLNTQNISTSYLATIPREHTLEIRWNEEGPNGRTYYSIIEFGSYCQDYVLIERIGDQEANRRYINVLYRPLNG